MSLGIVLSNSIRTLAEHLLSLKLLMDNANTDVIIKVGVSCPGRGPGLPLPTRLLGRDPSNGLPRPLGASLRVFRGSPVTLA